MITRTSILLIAAAALASAQTSVGLPDLGFVHDRAAKALRPIWGIPGSAFHGKPLDLGYDVLKSVTISSNNLIIAAAADAVYVVHLRPEGIESVPLPGMTGTPDLLSTSPAGRFAAAYYAGANTLYIAGDLATRNPSVTTAPLAALTHPPTALALNDDGRIILTISQNDDGHRVLHRIDAETGAVAAMDGFTQPSAVAFLNGSDSFVVADSQSITLMRDGERTVVWSPGEESSAFDLAQISLNNKSALLAASETRIAAIVDLASGHATKLACPFKPSRLQPLALEGLYLLADIESGIAWLFETTGGGRLLFVPPEIADAQTTSVEAHVE